MRFIKKFFEVLKIGAPDTCKDHGGFVNSKLAYENEIFAFWNDFVFDVWKEFNELYLSEYHQTSLIIFN